MPALNSADRVIKLRVIQPPLLQPHTPTRSGSTQLCFLSQRAAATRSGVSASPTRFTIRFSSFLLIPVADRLSTLTTTYPASINIWLHNVSPCQAFKTWGADAPP